MSYEDNNGYEVPQKGKNGGAFVIIVDENGVPVVFSGGAGSTMVIPTGQTRKILGLTNANAISFKRKDGNVLQVTVRAEALKI